MKEMDVAVEFLDEMSLIALQGEWLSLVMSASCYQVDIVQTDCLLFS